MRDIHAAGIVQHFQIENVDSRIGVEAARIVPVLSGTGKSPGLDASLPFEKSPSRLEDAIFPTN
jgi:hypothetical protein